MASNCSSSPPSLGYGVVLQVIANGISMKSMPLLRFAMLTWLQLRWHNGQGLRTRLRPPSHGGVSHARFIPVQAHSKLNENVCLAQCSSVEGLYVNYAFITTLLCICNET